MRRCPTCGAGIEVDEQSCGSCGATFEVGEHTGERTSSTDRRTGRGGDQQGQPSGRDRGIGPQGQNTGQGYPADRDQGRREQPGRPPGHGQPGGTYQGQHVRGPQGQRPPAQQAYQPGQPQRGRPGSVGGTGRRNLLKYGTAAAILAGGGWVAYDRVLGGGTDEVMRDSEWLVAPEALDRNGYHFGRLSIADVRQHESDLDPERVDRLRRDLDEFYGLSYDRFDGAVLASDFVVVTGDVDADDAESELVDEGFEPTDRYRNFQLYGDGNGATAAVAGRAVVLAPGFGTPPADERVRAVLDANAGDAPRYQQANEDCATVLSKLGRGLAVGGLASTSPDQLPEGTNAFGAVYRFEEAEFRFRIVTAFDDAEAVDVRTPSDFRERLDVPVEGLRDVDVTVDGRWVHLDAAADAAETDFLLYLP